MGLPRSHHCGTPPLPSLAFLAFPLSMTMMASSSSSPAMRRLAASCVLRAAQSTSASCSTIPPSPGAGASPAGNNTILRRHPAGGGGSPPARAYGIQTYHHKYFYPTSISSTTATMEALVESLRSNPVETARSFADCLSPAERGALMVRERASTHPNAIVSPDCALNRFADPKSTRAIHPPIQQQQHLFC